MRQRVICGVGILLASVLCACGSKETNTMETVVQEMKEMVDETTICSEETYTDETYTGETIDGNNGIESSSEITVVEETEAVEEIGITTVVVENPSWEYFMAEERVSDTKPYQLILMEEEWNDIIDTEEWFVENELEEDVSDEEGYRLEVDNRYVSVYDGSQSVTVLDFINYRYPDEYLEEDAAYIEEEVKAALVSNGVLYVATSHNTYAQSAPANAYITAISLEDYSIIWKSQPLVCNAYNFTIVEDVLFCGYGFTSEPDYLYQLDKKTGAVLDKTELRSKPEYINYKDGKLYVRTYNTNYIFGVE